jgi:aspartate kinase
LHKARAALDALKNQLACGDVLADEQIAKLSIVGVGMRSHTGVASKMFSALAEEGVNIQMISTSEIKVSVIISLAKAEEAMRAVHRTFLG